MISSLYIKNIALIQELNLELNKGLNVLSGETGAGKSIIIDSINFVLGNRADKTLIRFGEKTAMVELVFSDIKNIESVKELLDDAGIEMEDDLIIISRKMSNDKSECRVNHHIVTVSLLRNIVALLVDIHSQNEHQSLLKVSNHIKILDKYNGKIASVKSEYCERLEEYNALKNRLAELKAIIGKETDLEELRKIVDELEKFEFKDGEEDELISKRSRFNNAKMIYESLTESMNRLSNDSGYDVVTGLNQSGRALSNIVRFDEELNDIITRLDNVKIEIEDIINTIDSKLSDDDIFHLDIDALEKRLSKIRMIKKNYGQTEEEINAYIENVKKQIFDIEHADLEIGKVENGILEAKKKLVESAKKLHDLRVETSKKFEKDITGDLVELGMKNAQFAVQIDFVTDVDEYGANGADIVEFMLTPNLVEPLKPLEKIASGGEMSRFMLAIKDTIADIDDIETLIFDEIDTGISGNIAKVVSRKLYNISLNRQVIAITHLPQLASMADWNYLIEKNVVEDKTITSVKMLDENEIYTELMRLSGAVMNSQIGLSNAKELKNESNEYKRKLNAN